MKFSVILPVRNGGAYVQECIASIFAQSFTGYNIVVLDNCSTDGTSEWIGSLNDSRIVYHRSSTDLSIGQNWGRIRDVAKNEFMTMIGHDDLLHPNYLEEMDRLIQQHPDASLYQTHFKYINAEGGFVRNCEPMPARLSAADFLALQMTRSIDSTGTGYMMRSVDFNELGGMPVAYPNLIFSDFQLWINLMRKSYLAISVNQCFSYRLHESVSKVTNGMEYQQAFVMYIEFLLKTMEQDEAIREAVKNHGREFLLYYTEAMAHRLLKTPIEKRSIRVGDFIKKAEELAAQFIPGQDFQPMKISRIRVAKYLDQWGLTRKLFQRYRKI